MFIVSHYITKYNGVKGFLNLTLIIEIYNLIGIRSDLAIRNASSAVISKLNFLTYSPFKHNLIMSRFHFVGFLFIPTQIYWDFFVQCSIEQGLQCLFFFRHFITPTKFTHTILANINFFVSPVIF